MSFRAANQDGRTSATCIRLRMIWTFDQEWSADILSAGGLECYPEKFDDDNIGAIGVHAYHETESACFSYSFDIAKDDPEEIHSNIGHGLATYVTREDCADAYKPVFNSDTSISKSTADWGDELEINSLRTH